MVWCGSVSVSLFQHLRYLGSFRAQMRLTPLKFARNENGTPPKYQATRYIEYEGAAHAFYYRFACIGKKKEQKKLGHDVVGTSKRLGRAVVWWQSAMFRNRFARKRIPPAFLLCSYIFFFFSIYVSTRTSIYYTNANCIILYRVIKYEQFCQNLTRKSFKNTLVGDLTVGKYI